MQRWSIRDCRAVREPHFADNEASGRSLLTMRHRGGARLLVSALLALGWTSKWRGRRQARAAKRS